jgi:hypothetical protein
MVLIILNSLQSAFWEPSVKVEIARKFDTLKIIELACMSVTVISSTSCLLWYSKFAHENRIINFLGTLRHFIYQCNDNLSNFKNLQLIDLFQTNQTCWSNLRLATSRLVFFSLTFELKFLEVRISAMGAHKLASLKSALY